MTQQPINYANWQTIQPKKPGRQIFGWVLFVSLAVVLFMLLNKSSPGKFSTIPLSAFQERLTDGRVMNVTIQGDELLGSFRSSEAVMGVGNVRDFRVALPTGTGSSWEFVHWLLENRKDATVQVENNPSLLNVLLPLIPWLLIFVFIWFFVFRQLRNLGNRGPSAVYLVNPPPPLMNQPPPPLLGGPQV